MSPASRQPGAGRRQHAHSLKRWSQHFHLFAALRDNGRNATTPNSVQRIACVRMRGHTPTRSIPRELSTLEDSVCPRANSISFRKGNAASEDRAHDLRIMGPTRCQLRYHRTCDTLSESNTVGMGRRVAAAPDQAPLRRHHPRTRPPTRFAPAPFRCALFGNSTLLRRDCAASALCAAIALGGAMLASCGIRAHDLPLTERVLCQLS